MLREINWAVELEKYNNNKNVILNINTNITCKWFNSYTCVTGKDVFNIKFTLEYNDTLNDTTKPVSMELMSFFHH